MADTQSVSPGAPPNKWPTLSASWINRVSKMLNWFSRNVESGESSGGSSALESTSGLVKIKNLVDTAGEGDDPTPQDLLRGHYVQLGDYLLDDIDHHKHWYEGKLYDSTKKGRIAILLKASKGGLSEGDVSGDIQRARILGRCTAIINISDVTHRFAKPTTGEYVLKSSTGGPVEILETSLITGTGEQELPVLLNGSGGGDETLQAIFMVVYDLVGAPSGDTSSITPGSGTAKRYNTNSSTGVRTPEADTGDPPFNLPTLVNVLNYHKSETYDPNTGIYCRFYGSLPVDPGEPNGETKDWYEVICGDCNEWGTP